MQILHWVAHPALAALDAARDALVGAIRQCLYFYGQATWLQSRFPDAEFRAVPGLCAAVPRVEIGAHDSSLTPGRYVGVAPADMGDDEEFEERMREIHEELADLNQESLVLSQAITSNFEALL